MNAYTYLQEKLQTLQRPLGMAAPNNEAELVEAIYHLLMSKKFRKYSVTEQYKQHVRNAITQNVKNGTPINVTFLGGCYKLWRLDEAPESDWAELFACMYYTAWLKPICEIYPAGAWFDFFLDDLIVPIINNISDEDVETYRASRQRVLDFLKPYQPENMKMTLTGVGSLFKTKDEFNESLASNVERLTAELPGGLPELSEAAAATITLNVKVTPEQEKDPKWREKVDLKHSAYMMTKGETGYTATADKIRAFTTPLGSGTTVSIGTTKDSVAKFWVGVGALRPNGDNYRQIILSPKQLADAKFHWEDIELSGLQGKNFSKIRILDN